MISLVVESADFDPAGVRSACWALPALREPGAIDRVRQAPFPRLQALLDILADAPEITASRITPLTVRRQGGP